MGYNTTVLVFNDALDAIADDPGFGARLKQAVLAVAPGSPVNVYACDRHGASSVAAQVIETHPAQRKVLIEVGENMATVCSPTNKAGA